jgi:hypothetical protein
MSKTARKLDTEDIRRAAAGRWPEILERVAGIPGESLDPSREHPCPKCAGDTRFRLVDEAAGAVLCSHCFSKKNGDGFAAVGWMLNISFAQAKERIAEHLGIVAAAGPDPSKDLEWRPWSSALAAHFVAAKPGVTEAALLDCGGRMAMHYGKKVIALPIIGEENPDAVGWVLVGYDGRATVPKYDQKTKETHYVASKITYGSTEAGLLGRHGMERLKTVALAELVWKVEGISDMLALQAIIPEQLRERHLVVTNPKGSKESPKWQSTLLAKCNCNVIHDADEPGQAGAEKWSRDIAAQAAEGVVVRNVNLPYQVTGTKGKDLRDWLAEGHGYSDLLALAEQSVPLTVKRNAAGEVDAGEHLFPIQELILKKLQLEVLYEDETGAVRVFSTLLRKSSTIKKISMLRHDDLWQICGAPATIFVAKRVESGAEDQWTVEDVRKALGLAAAQRRGKNDERGAGAWQGLDDFGNETETIVLVGNADAARWNGDKVLRKVLAPRCDGLTLNLGSGDKDWYRFDVLEKLLSDAADVDWRCDVIDEATALFDRWLWKHQDVDPSLMVGLVLSTWVQTIWDYRPLVAVSGTTNSGKSFLFEALGGSMNRRGIFGNLAFRQAKSSCAGVMQGIGRTAKVALCDEFEHSKERDKILDAFRQSTRGDSKALGTASQKHIELQLRHIGWVAAIETGLQDEADVNRFIQLELIRPDPQDHGKLRLPPAKWLDDLGQKLLAIAVRSAIEAKAMATAMKDTFVQGIDSRTIEGFSVPAAMLAVAGNQDEESAKQLLHRLLANVDKGEQGRSDQDELMGDILTASVYLDPKEGVKTVGQVLESPALRMSYSARLEAAGVRLLDDYSVFLAPKLVSHNLLRGTAREGQKIDQILLRIKGSERRPLRIGGRMTRGLVIPPHAVGLEHGQFTEGF